MKQKLLFLSMAMMILTFSYSQITTVGLIGEFTDWGDDVDMTQDVDNADLWTLTVTLPDGPVKFRANDDWAINWGSSDFPSGVGIQDGDDVPVWAGDYYITFNSATGEYNFEVDTDIGIIGSATPGGWDFDTNMYKDTISENGFFIEVFLAQGEVKFRKDDDWAVNWGSADFPSGIGTQDGDNIPIEQAGDYRIEFDTVTGAYLFSEIITFEAIGLIGDATPGGWDEDTDLVQDGVNPDLWSANIELTDGEAKFRANDDWAVNWGSADFPTGVGVQDGDNIPVVAGLYEVSLNTATGEYNFLPVVYYATVGMIGDATPGGWAEDTDMDVDPNDPASWSKRLIFTTGEAKFRADNDWAANWGSGDFPSGVAVQDGANIPVPEGEYLVTFNTTSGEYNFKEIVVFQTVGIIGTGTPLGHWDEDVDMDKDPGDEHHWTISSITLSEGEVKFRAEDDWAVNWGAPEWPNGIGTQDGDNILCLSGTYGVSLYSNTGEYAFGNPGTSTYDLLDPKDITVFPNPAYDHLNIDLSKLDLKGDVHISIMDNAGRMIMNQTFAPSTSVKLEVSSLQTGSYIMQIKSKGYLVGKYISILK